MKTALAVLLFSGVLFSSDVAQAAATGSFTGQVRFPGGATYSINIHPDSPTAASGKATVAIFTGTGSGYFSSFTYTRASNRIQLHGAAPGGYTIDIDLSDTNMGQVGNPGTFTLTSSGGQVTVGTVTGHWGN